MSKKREESVRRMIIGAKQQRCRHSSNIEAHIVTHYEKEPGKANISLSCIICHYRRSYEYTDTHINSTCT